jgi:hypothetical protein
VCVCDVLLFFLFSSLFLIRSHSSFPIVMWLVPWRVQLVDLGVLFRFQAEGANPEYVPQSSNVEALEEKPTAAASTTTKNVGIMCMLLLLVCLSVCLSGCLSVYVCTSMCVLPCSRYFQRTSSLCCDYFLSLSLCLCTPLQRMRRSTSFRRQNKLRDSRILRPTVRESVKAASSIVAKVKAASADKRLGE